MSLTVEKCLQAWTNSLRQMNAKADIVFFGDSLTYYGDFSSVFPDKIVCNLGLRGDTIQGLIDRVEQLKMLEPKLVCLMAGINNVENTSVQIFEEIYELLILKIKSSLPYVELVIQSMLPVNNARFSISCNNKQIVERNRIIESLAFKYNISYTDLFSIYISGGYLPVDFTYDGLHLKPSAYEMWYLKIKELI